MNHNADESRPVEKGTSITMAESLPLSSPEQWHTEAKNHNSTAKEPGVHTSAEQQPQGKAEQAAVVQIPSATHGNPP